ncbi:hypothetical protein Acr_28g0008410 [Actinidia rufa]|uniref:Phototropic-responsive NPH3 family protein n=1 Tax=Actinidia rufa TaxID=165716 RepID=A0A7J0HAM9_9ERIC|nr:hypothetical protein Acr_28g0008410 [Actinidia rufa]
MGASTMEEGVLKLVHPGRHVEIHKEPITAAEVMRKNPRHCVTRPDVFKFPWIVVKPESILFPGTVFYIVPNQTIHRLIKARGNYNQCPKYHDNHRAPKQTSTHKSSAGSTPKHRDNGHWLKRPFMCTTSSEEEDSDKSQQSYSESWSKVIANNRNKYKIRSFGTKEYNGKRSRDTAILPVNDNHNAKYKSCEQSRSCLRKQDSVRKSRYLRVTFAFPITTRSGKSPALRQH